MEVVARELIPPFRDDPMLRHGAENEGDDDFIAPGPVDELLRNRGVVLERRNALVPRADHEASVPKHLTLILLDKRPQPANVRDEPPPRYTREPTAPRHVSSCTGCGSGRTLTTFFRVPMYLRLTLPSLATQSG